MPSELVSKEFAQAVFDNCLSRDILAMDNPELCERVAQSLGTLQREERTVQYGDGPLLTQVLTGTGSSKLVEAYRLHPNAIKALPRCGQGFLVGAAHVGDGAKLLPTDGATPVCYPRLPRELLEGCDYPLKRNDLLFRQVWRETLSTTRRVLRQAGRPARRSTRDGRVA